LLLHSVPSDADYEQSPPVRNLKLVQYGAKVLIPVLQARARLQHRAGLRDEPTSALIPKLAKLASIIGDARTLWGIWGMLPTIQWLISLERASPPTRRLRTIERTQGWLLLAFYHLQHLFYLSKHELIPLSSSIPSFLSLPSSSSSVFSEARGRSGAAVTINGSALSVWSSRFWAAYVVLQLAHLREDRALIVKRQRTINRLSPKEKERVEFKRRWDEWYNELAVNLSYLPMTIHWSLEKGLFKNDTWISLFGLAAAIVSFRSGWNATALPPSAPSVEPEPEAEKASGSGNADEAPQGSTSDTGYDVDVQ